MNWLTFINSLILLAILLGLLLKMAHGDASNACCAMVIMVLAVAAAVLALIAWGVGMIFGWWATPW